MEDFYFGDRRIRVVMQDRSGRPAARATRRFTGGAAGPEDAGTYAFWTVTDALRPLFIFRTKAHSPIEDILCDRNRLSPAQLEALETSADRVLPATPAEVNLWPQANPGEAAHVVAA